MESWRQASNHSNVQLSLSYLELLRNLQNYKISSNTDWWSSVSSIWWVSGASQASSTHLNSEFTIAIWTLLSLVRFYKTRCSLKNSSIVSVFHALIDSFSCTTPLSSISLMIGSAPGTCLTTSARRKRRAISLWLALVCPWNGLTKIGLNQAIASEFGGLFWMFLRICNGGNDSKFTQVIELLGLLLHERVYLRVVAC